MSIKAIGVLASFCLVIGTAVPVAAECSPERWIDCAGKSWVVGDKMETPLGER